MQKNNKYYGGKQTHYGNKDKDKYKYNKGFDSKEQYEILEDFPTNINISYETVVHKKISDAQIILAIPDGVRYCVWFTTYKNNNVCWLLELNLSNKVVNIQKCLTSYHDTLCYGTVLYGTLFNYNSSVKCFSIEDMYYCKGHNIQPSKYGERLQKIHNLFKSCELNQTIFTNRMVMFGLPYMDTSYENVLKVVSSLPYKTQFLQFQYLEESNGNIYNLSLKTILETKPIVEVKQSNKPFQQTQRRDSLDPKKKKTTVFKVIPDIQNDIYHLYSSDGVFVDIAYIQTYEKSVMMNKLFRNIKENDRLDALEESDDEEEFENNNQDKFVFLDRSYLMECDFNYKFKKWMPIKIVNKY
jgi:hypothetical protein